MSLKVQKIHLPPEADPAESTAAQSLARQTGAAILISTENAHGVLVSLASRKLCRIASGDHEAWMWLRIDQAGGGEIVASHGSFLYAAVRLLEGSMGIIDPETLAKGMLIPASFPWHRPLFDACLTQYWRTSRKFDPEAAVAALAEYGFTHLEVNGMHAHMPYEDLVANEYYPQFYNYCAGFNHFVDSELTRGFWPALYLDANLNTLKRLADLGKKFGLAPGLLMFEPRTMPERFFARYPTLRGARVDHPFRSRLPRYTLAQDHPIVMRHYREVMLALMRAVPELEYLSFWTNDSGAGFEHTASLYVGRNGGPFMIREWRNHDKVAEAAGGSIVRFMKNVRDAAAQINPKFEVFLRIESFKVEHEHIKRGLGPGVGFEAPSLLVRGYSLPYPHPRYPENFGVAGTIFHDWLAPEEGKALQECREQGIDPALHYVASGVWNHEPLLGLPFPRLIHRKLLSLRQTGLRKASCYGGLTNPAVLPYWPNPVAIRAAQFFPGRSIDDVLHDYAVFLVGETHAEALCRWWNEVEEALTWQPLVGLYCAFGFCWQRTWDRPFVPDIEAVPAEEREYYERHGCFQHNNPGLNDLGKDVLFDLITREQGTRMSADMDREVLPRLDAVLEDIGQVMNGLDEADRARPVFVDLRDRVRGYRHWVTALRNVCAWCAHVYTYLEASDSEIRAGAEKQLQATIDLDLANTRGLLEFIETTCTEFMAVSSVAESTFFYGENLPELLRRRIRLTEAYRHHAPRIDRTIMWRPAPGTHWPKGWLEEAFPSSSRE